MTRHLPNAPTLARVGVEERDAADHAVVAAFRHAPALRLEVGLVHASSAPLDDFSHVDPLGVKRAGGYAATRWNNVLQAAGGVGAALEDTLEIIPGSPANALVERALLRWAGVILVGRHERRGAFDFGDVVHDVVSSATCPVWVQLGAPRDVRRILCAIETSGAIDFGRSSLAVPALARERRAGLRGRAVRPARVPAIGTQLRARLPRAVPLERRRRRPRGRAVARVPRPAAPA